MTRETYIYLIRDNATGFIKIGHSKSPEARLKELCSQKTLLPTSHDFEIIAAWEGYTETERDLHNHFRLKRIRGEWFDLTEENVATIHYILLDMPKYHFTSRKHCEAGMNFHGNEPTRNELLDFIYKGDLPKEYYN